MLRRDPRTGIRHLRDGLAILDPGGRSQPAAARHRVARVEEQVQKHLLKLVFDAVDRGRAAHSSRRILMLLDCRTGARAATSRPVITVFRSMRVRSPSAVPGRDNVSRPFTIFAARNVCCSIFSSSRVLRIVGSAPLEQHLRVTGDDGERRIDLVRHARRQQADGRHLLRNLKLLLQSDPLGDVLDQQNRP